MRTSRIGMRQRGVNGASNFDDEIEEERTAMKTMHRKRAHERSRRNLQLVVLSLVCISIILFYFISIQNSPAGIDVSEDFFYNIRFVVIGFPKAGTTILTQSLLDHPRVTGPHTDIQSHKIDFLMPFRRSQCSKCVGYHDEAGYLEAAKDYECCQLRTLLSHFNLRLGMTYAFQIPAGVMWPHLAKQISPLVEQGTKLIFLIRDPVFMIHSYFFTHKPDDLKLGYGSYLYRQLKRHEKFAERISGLLSEHDYQKLMEVWRSYIYEECAVLMLQLTKEAENKCYLRIGLLAPIFLPQILIWITDAQLSNQDVRFVFYDKFQYDPEELENTVTNLWRWMNLNPYDGNFTYRIKGTELPNKKEFTDGVHAEIEKFYRPFNEALVNFLRKRSFAYSECTGCEEFGDYESRHRQAVQRFTTRKPKLTKGVWD